MLYNYGYLLIVILLLSTGLSCDETTNEDALCFFFDQRQCAGDEWADLISGNDTWETRENAMANYLEGKSIELKEIYITPNFHEAVCEACFICPEEHRFFVKISSESKSALEGLDLLNVSEGDCDDLFN